MSKSIEQTYIKLSQREHVLLRGGMYVGSTKKQMEEIWVPNNDLKMEKHMIEYTPAFIKIFDEILTNATDHSFRHDTVTQIKVNYNQDTGEISVFNNGPGIPIIIHKEHNIYIPELLFGNLLSGSNYNDSEDRNVAGLNGLGSKCTNIFSKKFIVETVDSENKKKYIQEFSDNLSVISKPKITNYSKSSYTKITFLPDYSRFDMKNLEKDSILLINKRVIDCIACTNENVSIYLQDIKLKGKGLLDYCKYYFDDSKIFIETFNEKIKSKNNKEFINYVWEYAVVPYTQFEQISFVNGNSTIQGGKHVDYIMYQILTKYKTMLESKKKLKELKPNFIKDKMFFFLRATVSNPSFNSQNKEQLTTPSKDFGCVVQVTDKFIDKLYKSSITNDIVEFCKAKEIASISKTTDGSKKNRIFIPKLEDAVYAGTNKSNLCSLILTEGLSAMTFALHGRTVIGAEYIGVFPLRGKVLNLRDASISQITSNEEICNIKQILGLKENKVYNNTNDLRYGKVIILTDADVDGTHIKSLLVNFLHFGWSNLLKLNPSFIQTLKTPIVKAIKGKEIKEFFTEQDYNKWKENNTNLKNFKIKYFKGLGSSTKEDAKDIFKRFKDLIVDYYYEDEKCFESILLAFDKDKNNKQPKKNKNDNDDNLSDNFELVKCSDKRKEWLSNYDKNSYIDMKHTKISFQELINKELIHFSIYDNIRSIPSLCDGLKPSQRKILHYMLQKNITDVIKVAQLSGYVSAETSYHHGEASLQGAIIGMAQNYVGSNNINLLYPDGEFGSRYNVGKDAASPRYIFTKLNDITTKIFNKLDLPLLSYLNDDGLSIEPEFFLPIIPMILVNGCAGIGTGFSTFIPPYNPKHIIKQLLQLLQNESTELSFLHPWFKNFLGILEYHDNGNYITKGKWKQINNTTIEITEIPIGLGVTPYKEFLESFIDQNKKSEKKTDKKIDKKTDIILKDVQNLTTDENIGIRFLVEFKDQSVLKTLIDNDLLEKELKLAKSFSINNMYLFNENLILTKFNSVNDIIKHFYNIRLKFYQKRKDYLINKLKNELLILESKKRFIEEYISGQLIINKKSKNDIIILLNQREYITIENNYDYLLNMPIYSLTLEKIEKLESQVIEKTNELNYYLSKSNKELWKLDLIELQEFLSKK